MSQGVARWTWRTIGMALIVLPAAPLARWIGATDQGPAAWGPHVAVWGYGIGLTLVGAVLAGRLARQVVPTARLRVGLSPRALAFILPPAFTVLAAFTMVAAFARNPHLIDEVAQLFQAKILASGRLAAPVPEPEAAFLFQLTSITPAGWVSQFPPGESVLLALGWLMGAEWLVNPVLGGVSVALVYWLARGLYGPKTAGVAAFLWAASAWVMFMSATYMNHVAAATLAPCAWAFVWGARQPGVAHLLGAGCSLAALAATRPLDAVAAAMPIGAWIAWRSRWRHALWLTIGALPILGAWGFVNWRLYGSPALLGYTTLYGPAHGLGFHIDPYGEAYTPLVALSNMAVAIQRLHIYLYEWPIPALLPLAVWALVAKHRHPADLVVAIGVAAAPVLYALYWHSGFYLGPRFYYVAVPFLAIATARGWRWARRLAWRADSHLLHADASLIAAAVIVLVWGWLSFVPARFASYRGSLPSFKLHPEQILEEAGAGRALVLVDESWGSRVVAELWALGALPGLVERAYRRVDLCDLDGLARDARANSMTAVELNSQLERATQDAVPATPRVPGAPDPSLRLRTDRTLPPTCQTELQRDLAGFTVYGNLAWRNPVDLESGNVWARNLFDRNAGLLEQYPDREVYRWTPGSAHPDSLPRLTRVGRTPGVVGAAP